MSVEESEQRIIAAWSKTQAELTAAHDEIAKRQAEAERVMANYERETDLYLRERDEARAAVKQAKIDVLTMAIQCVRAEGDPERALDVLRALREEMT